MVRFELHLWSNSYSCKLSNLFTSVSSVSSFGNDLFHFQSAKNELLYQFSVYPRPYVRPPTYSWNSLCHRRGTTTCIRPTQIVKHNTITSTHTPPLHYRSECVTDQRRRRKSKFHCGARCPRISDRPPRPGPWTRRTHRRFIASPTPRPTNVSFIRVPYTTRGITRVQ